MCAPEEGGGGGAAAPPRESRRWFVVALAVLETLTATGVMFGFSGLSLALVRDGVFAELCDGADPAPCKAQRLRLAFVYAAGCTGFQVSLCGWGPVVDAFGSRVARLAGLALSGAGAVLMVFADSETFDVYVPGAVLLSAGGAGFFLSHFVLADHFRRTPHFGLVHTLINCAMDSSTVTFAVLEVLHEKAGVSVKDFFVGFAALLALYALLTLAWGEFLNPLHDDDDEDCDADDTAAAVEKEPVFGRKLDMSGVPFLQQLRSTHFLLLAVWVLCTTSRVMFVLGTVQQQVAGDDGDSQGQDARSVGLVRGFNALLVLTSLLSPLFGRLIDTKGVAPGLALVNCLGILCFSLLAASPTDAGLYVAFGAYGCFRAWNFTGTSVYTQGVFGHASFGRIYGLGTGVANVTAALLQYPLVKLATDYTSYAVVDWAFVVIGASVFVFPAWVGSRWGARTGGGALQEPLLDASAGAGAV